MEVEFVEGEVILSIVAGPVDFPVGLNKFIADDVLEGHGVDKSCDEAPESFGQGAVEQKAWH